jgi:hypothetical protein
LPQRIPANRSACVTRDESGGIDRLHRQGTVGQVGKEVVTNTEADGRGQN